MAPHVSSLSPAAGRIARPRTSLAERVLPAATAWYLLALVPLVVLGFWPGYFSHPLTGIAGIVHAHTATMLLWLALVLVQPLLIRRRQLRWHRRLGQLSYLVMPVLLTTGYLLLQHRYQRKLAQIAHDVATGQAPFGAEQIGPQAAATLRLGVVYFALLALFYALAVWHRRRVLAHATYMLAASLTLLGPALDRVIGHAHQFLRLQPGFVAAHASLLIILAGFGALAYYQRRQGQRVRPALTALGIYLAAAAALDTLPKTAFWPRFIELII